MARLYYNLYEKWVETARCPEWWMITPGMHNKMYKGSRTLQERRRWFRDMEEDVRLRWGRSPFHLNPAGTLEKFISCIDSKSWKKLYKKRKQYL